MNFLNKKKVNDCVQYIILQKFTNFHANLSWSFQNICNEIGWHRFLHHPDYTGEVDKFILSGVKFPEMSGTKNHKRRMGFFAVSLTSQPRLQSFFSCEIHSLSSSFRQSRQYGKTDPDRIVAPIPNWSSLPGWVIRKTDGQQIFGSIWGSTTSNSTLV